MLAKKRFFPNNSKRSKPRPISFSRTVNRPNLDKSYGTGRNLREEFDRIVTEKHTLISEEALDYIWHIASEKILRNPLAPLENIIEELDITP
jgi:hypothetical protein